MTNEELLARACDALEHYLKDEVCDHDAGVCICEDLETLRLLKKAVNKTLTYLDLGIDELISVFTEHIWANDFIFPTENLVENMPSGVHVKRGNTYVPVVSIEDVETDPETLKTLVPKEIDIIEAALETAYQNCLYRLLVEDNKILDDYQFIKIGTAVGRALNKVKHDLSWTSEELAEIAHIVGFATHDGYRVGLKVEPIYDSHGNR